MYCEFYGFREKPFNVTSDPGFFFLTDRHKEALAHLLYGVTERKGIVVLTGEIGTGKTTLCRYLLSRLDKKVKTALVLNPCLSETQLLEAVVEDFGLPVRKSSRLKLLQELNDFLMREARLGNNIALIVDEAQNLKPQVLEQIRLLSNLETEKDKLLQVVLAGQPELADKLNLHSLRQLRQRIMVKSHIYPLQRSEVPLYIRHRLSVASTENTEVEFTDDAVETISHFSGGTPRVINLICDRALLAGYVNRKKILDTDIIQSCLEDLTDHLVGV
ncbi:MAG: AAA family ATPase [Candidatus Omnitrophica bacterium]|nr:AAA family ATPase [Candidatus Omnitrophota bacterium]